MVQNGPNDHFGQNGLTVAVEIKSILIPKQLIVEFEMTFIGK